MTEKFSDVLSPAVWEFIEELNSAYIATSEVFPEDFTTEQLEFIDKCAAEHMGTTEETPEELTADELEFIDKCSTEEFPKDLDNAPNILFDTPVKGWSSDKRTEREPAKVGQPHELKN